MPHLSDSNLVKSASPFLTVSAYKRNRSSLLKKLGAILDLPLPDPDTVSNRLNIDVLHFQFLLIFSLPREMLKTVAARGLVNGRGPLHRSGRDLVFNISLGFNRVIPVSTDFCKQRISWTSKQNPHMSCPAR